MLSSYQLIFRTLFLINFNYKMISAALDVNVYQLKHLADHLSVNDCKHFVASLHYKSFEFPSTVGNQVMRLDPDDTCLELLKKWNSGEGKTATHSILATRLRQMGRSDLSLWLSASVFKQLTQKLQGAIKGEDSEDSDLEQTTMPDKSSPTDIVKEVEVNAFDEDNVDVVSLSELAGSIIALACVLYGWFKLYQKCCKKTADNK